MSRVRFGVHAGLVLIVGVTTAFLRTTSSAPLPKDVVAFRIKLAGEKKIPDLMIEAATFLDETKVVAVGTVAFVEEDGKILDINKLDANGAILDLAKNSHIPFTNGHTARIGSAAVAGNRVFTASNNNDPHVRIWDIKAAKTLAEIKIEDPGQNTPRYGVACFHKGDRIAITAWKKVIVLDPAKPDDRTEFNLPEEERLWLCDDIAVSPGDDYIVVSGGKAHVVSWNVATKKATALSLASEEIKEEDNWLSRGKCFTPTSGLLATRFNYYDEVDEAKLETDVPADRRGVVQIDLAKKKAIPLKVGHTVSTLSCAIDPTGTWLATGGSSRRDKPKGDKTDVGELRVYHLATQTLVHREQLDGLPLKWVGFSSSGKRLAATTYDGVVRWWDVTAK